MRRTLPLVPIALLSLAAAAPAPAQVVESQVRTLAEDENEIVGYNIACDPSPHADPIEFGCSCEIAGVYGADEKCLADRHLYRFTNLPGERLRSDSFSCDADSCAFIPPAMPPDESLAIAETTYGANFVRVASLGHQTEPDRIYNEAAAVSRWADRLTLTTSVPDLSGASLTAVFRVRGSWENEACFVVKALLYQENLPPPPGVSRAEFANGEDVVDAFCLVDDPFGLLFPPPGFTDYGAADGAIDLAFPLEIPLTLPAEVSLSGELRAYSLFENSRLDGPDGGLEMTVERLEVPVGVEISSAADALAAYNLPEPPAAASAVFAFAALLALRKR